MLTVNILVISNFFKLYKNLQMKVASPETNPLSSDHIFNFDFNHICCGKKVYLNVDMVWALSSTETSMSQISCYCQNLLLASTLYFYKIFT